MNDRLYMLIADLAETVNRLARHTAVKAELDRVEVAAILRSLTAIEATARQYLNDGWTYGKEEDGDE